MSVVSFPGLNVYFEFSKIAFSIFGLAVYKYAICIVLGIVVALVLAKLSKEKFENDFSFVLENTIIGIIFGTIGARLYYVLFNLDYYSNNFGEIFNFRNGGLAIYGGLILGGLAILINCKIRKKDILNFFDYIIPFVAIAQCFGRIGNFFNVEAFGYETTSFFRMGVYTLEGYMEVHPTFFYESVSTLLIFIILRFIQKKRAYKGQVILWYFVLYSAIRTVIEGLRADSLMIGQFRASQVLSILILVSCISILVYRKIKTMKKVENKKEETEKIEE